MALEVPDEIRRPLDTALGGLREQHDGLRWTPAEQWHLTLAFIGHVDVDVAEVVAGLAPAADSAPERIDLRLAGAGRFGDRVLWIGVDDDPADAVSELGAATQRSLAAADLPVDERPVRPHITLARGRRRRPSRIRSELVEAVPTVAGAWSVDELALVESVQRGRGRPNRYDVRARIGFGG